MQNILQEWEEAGIIERTDNQYQHSHYLAYHVVTKLSSQTTKHRLVFNGSSAGSNGISLNDCLFKGTTNWSLVNSLLRFRWQKFTHLGDLSKAFLQVSLKKDCRNYFKFFAPSSIERCSYRWNFINKSNQSKIAKYKTPMRHLTFEFM